MKPKINLLELIAPFWNNLYYYNDDAKRYIFIDGEGVECMYLFNNKKDNRIGGDDQQDLEWEKQFFPHRVEQIVYYDYTHLGATKKILWSNRDKDSYSFILTHNKEPPHDYNSYTPPEESSSHLKDPT